MFGGLASAPGFAGQVLGAENPARRRRGAALQMRFIQGRRRKRNCLSESFRRFDVSCRFEFRFLRLRNPRNEAGNSSLDAEEPRKGRFSVLLVSRLDAGPLGTRLELRRRRLQVVLDEVKNDDRDGDLGVFEVGRKRAEPILGLLRFEVRSESIPLRLGRKKGLERDGSSVRQSEFRS